MPLWNTGPVFSKNIKRYQYLTLYLNCGILLARFDRGGWLPGRERHHENTSRQGAALL